MNHIIKSLRTVSKFQTTNRKVLLYSKTFARNSSITTWNKDWKPGPYPRTEEERIAAAKKYCMLPEDYEPYPEEEGFGDYPKFPPLHMEDRSDFEPYDYPHLKRNYCEPLHPDAEILMEDKLNYTKKLNPPLWKRMLILFGCVAIFQGILYIDVIFPPDLQRIPKQYPYSGQKHYTFEPADS